MKKISMILFFICFIVTACNSDTIDTPRYEGKSLVIGVIGDVPNVRKENVDFKKITFKPLEDLSPDYDAIFIMKEHLSEAANQKYAKVFKNSVIPFFFIESTKSYLPFIYEEMSYDEVPDLSSDTYATGYYQLGKEFQYWGYGLDNDNVKESNIADVYTRFFTTMESAESNNDSSAAPSLLLIRKSYFPLLLPDRDSTLSLHHVAIIVSTFVHRTNSANSLSILPRGSTPPIYNEEPTSIAGSSL